MQNLLDPTFNGMPGSELYRGEIFPELFPGKRMMLENWTQDDLGQYVGGIFTPGYGERRAA
ncbi:hypothetical protein C731_2956 [Mycolicibacterium hassiacum DSM 44199]|uniref:Uncharacterized protein n=1 Tax=Mycolicibacterium hassiacum (strain DSM 44199 / CIP 105218 / JCM 12690 / 3849) TaxID=1122247 RepID=K5B845_MYCHD|nr:hypothetical protein [Mycolicibacterium hassiacum]ARQ94622.1 hypothetical protein SEA_JOURNEY13_47 [Mycobacterium phage Journey13]EKF23058.1 hypothetical protein C731_2956 [Mycolicibacterium hassiacum DSM 44199]MDA4086059.1 hypothetical protein [Mycolicibacterium hassiacum DSM 44199]VCT89517.1 hypothetical protein MHAS_01211 [Mycolicibacterium hassiacum DSM 44199]